MVNKQKILIVDDDSNIAELISLYLTKECFDTMIVGDGESALKMVDSFSRNLTLLDLMLPGIDGYQVCREVRSHSNIPIIMLSAKGEIFDKVLGLELGADDYVVKPFDAKEVVARIKAVLRRCAMARPEEDGSPIRYDNLSVDLSRYELKVRGQTVDTPPKELELLYFLASHPNRVFSRDQLLDEVWGFDYFGNSRSVDVHIKRLREKLEGASDQWSLKTVWRIGYKFEVKDA